MRRDRPTAVVVLRLSVLSLFFTTFSLAGGENKVCEYEASPQDHTNRAPLTMSNRYSLYDDIESLLFASYLVQDIALFNNWNDIVGVEELQDPDFFKTLPRTISEVLDWMRSNMGVLHKARFWTMRAYDPGFVLNGLEAMVKQQQLSTGEQREEDATVELLDDDFGFRGYKSKPVYGITRNPGRKRLTVVFRGSINARDWQQDFKVQGKEVPLTPEELRKTVPNPDASLLNAFENVVVHAGFYEYLFESCEDHEKPKIETIIEEVMKRVKDPENEGYRVFFTGHSLGGALATLAAVAAGLSNDVAKSITLVTFASPHVMKGSAAVAFRELESKDRIRHLRITNHDDAVPQGLEPLGYVHTGIHLSLQNKNHSLTASSQEEFTVWTTKMRVSYLWFLGNPSHKLQVHKKRLDKAKEDLSKNSLDGLFTGQ